MPLTVDAVYENGTLKLAHPLPLKEQEKVRVTVEPARNWVDETSGMLGWTGDAETLDRILEEAEYDQWEDE